MSSDPSTVAAAKRFDLVEVLLICVLVGVVAAVARGQHADVGISPEVAWLSSEYGPQKHSEYVEEWVLRDFFGDRRNGVFLDVGAAHYKEASNTYFLETQLGWTGLAVEPQERFAADYARHRRGTRLFQYFVSDESDEEAVLYTNDHPMVASSRAEFTQRWGQSVKPLTVRTITLDDLLTRERVDSIDFVSMDIELAEPRALRGFDLTRFKPSLVCIEAHPEVRQQILDYFASRGYVAVGKYLRMDDRNLYFMPIGHAVKPLPAKVMTLWTGHS